MSILLRVPLCALLLLGLVTLSPTLFAQAVPEPKGADAGNDAAADEDSSATRATDDGDKKTVEASEPAPPAKAAVAISEAARTHFRSGVAYLQDPDGARYDEAYLEFKSAYADSPSPKMLANLGLCAMKIERVDEAIVAYSTYLADVPDIPDDLRAQIKVDLKALQASAVQVTLTVNVPGVTLVDTRQPVRGFPFTNTYGPVTRARTMRIKPGKHTFIAKLEGYEEQAWNFEAGPGDVEVFAFKLKAIVLESEMSAGDIVPWFLVGLGVAGGAVAAITGTIALNKSAEVRAECPNDLCPFSSDLDEQQDTVNTYGLATDILIASASASALAGVVWLVVDGGGVEEEVVESRVGFVAGCGPHGCSALAKVAF